MPGKGPERVVSRRDMLRQLGVAASGTLLWPWAGGGLASLSALGRPAGNRAAGIQEGAIIRTVLRDIDPRSLDGPVLMHEHLSMRYPLGVTEHFTDDVALMTEEVRIAAREGVACIVDAGHADMGRNMDALRQIARDSGMPIVASGGYYMQRSYPPELASRSAAQIADELVAEAARDRFGAFGEIGQQSGELTETERKVFQAIAMAQARTGIPIFTHNAYTGRRAGNVPREAGLRQLDILEANGGRPEHIAIGHVCCLDDPAADIAIQIARRGAYVGFDRVTLNAIMPDSARVTMALALIEAGHADRLLLASDFYSANSLKSRGGNGLAQTVTVFAPMLREAGVPEATLRQILVENPIRFLSFVPRA